MVGRGVVAGFHQRIELAAGQSRIAAAVVVQDQRAVLDVRAAVVIERV
jgi:hypothetical protein